MSRKNRKSSRSIQRDGSRKKKKGFTLFEVVVGIALVGIALLGLAQLFTFSVMNNSRSDRMTGALYLAQQQMDSLRNLTADELNALTTGPMDEQIDVNSDGTYDFRRITQVQLSGSSWSVRILVFSAEQLGVSLDSILQDPARYRVRADINTLISR
ncbi:MAG: prepilin-type N-terminal cleavage/methylation domain-containing protein [Candidatus Aminicenantales bacterium]